MLPRFHHLNHIPSEYALARRSVTSFTLSPT
jgi:hypothetical protein